jgi:DNA primase
MAEWVSFAELKARVSLEQVLRWYGVDWRRRSGRDQYRGRCPIHGGQGAEAFHVNLERNLFHCFSCGAGGNVLDMVAALEGCSLREAGLKLQARGGADACVGVVVGREKRKLVTKKRESNAPLSFSLSVQARHPYLAQRGIERATADYFGVGFYSGPGLMRGRLAIPIHDNDGRLVAYCGRALDGDTPRYRFPAGFQKAEVLFNCHRAVRAGASKDPVIVVEGFFDCMRVYQAGYARVVALMGCVLCERQAELLQRSFPAVVLLLDGDAVGRCATDRLTHKLQSRCTVRALDPGPGRQPDQLSMNEIHELLTVPEGRITSNTNAPASAG